MIAHAFGDQQTAFHRDTPGGRIDTSALIGERRPNGSTAKPEGEEWANASFAASGCFYWRDVRAGPTAVRLRAQRCAAAGRSRLPGRGIVRPGAGRRLTKSEYANTIADLLGVALDGGDLYLLPDEEPATGGGFRDDVAALLPHPCEPTPTSSSRARIAARVALGGRARGSRHLHRPDRRVPRGFIRHLGRLRLSPPADRRRRANPRAAVFATAAGSASRRAGRFELGARLVLQAMLQSPHFLYRLERRDARRCPSGRPAPSPFELATRLSYLLWASAPGPELLDAAERGDFSAARAGGCWSPACWATRALGADSTRYAQDWLQLYRLDARTPNDALGVGAALLAEMKQESARLVQRIAIDEGRDLTDILVDKRTDIGPALAQSVWHRSSVVRRRQLRSLE